MEDIQLSPAASPQEVLFAAQSLRESSIKAGVLTTPEKVFPQINANQGAWAYSALVCGEPDKDVADWIASGIDSLVARVLKADAAAALKLENAVINQYIRTRGVVSNHRIGLAKRLIKGKEVLSLIFEPIKNVKRFQEPVEQPTEDPQFDAHSNTDADYETGVAYEDSL